MPSRSQVGERGRPGRHRLEHVEGPVGGLHRTELPVDLPVLPGLRHAASSLWVRDQSDGPPRDAPVRARNVLTITRHRAYGQSYRTTFTSVNSLRTQTPTLGRARGHLSEGPRP